MKKEAAMRTFLMAAAAVLLLVPASATAGGAQPRNPFASLFTAQLPGVSPQAPNRPGASGPTLPPASSAPPARTVVCGLTIVQGGSKIDPMMTKPVPAGAPKGSIRIIPAPACKDK
jgi:hypothetical protein